MSVTSNGVESFVQKLSVFLICFFGAVVVCSIAFIGRAAENTKQSYPPASISQVSPPTLSSPPNTVLGLATHDRSKHVKDAVEYLLMDGRAAVREGSWTKEQFEKYTSHKY